MAAQTDLTPELLDKLEAIATAATPGPWQWFGNTKTNDVYLADCNRTFIMDFIRWGMAGAQPRFQDRQHGIMRSLIGMAKAEDPNGPVFEVPHRRDFTGIGHPDAKHIAAASPDVVLALVADARKLERITSSMEEMAVDFDRLGLIGGDLTATEIRRRMKEVLNGGT